MKAMRHAKIREIIEREVIETQEELAEALLRQDIKVTQATVSRDIKELMLIKVSIGNGRSRYAAPMNGGAVFSKKRMAILFRDSILGADSSGNLVVVKTMPGAANAVASALDYAKWPEIIGTVAGDDTILVVVKPASAAAEVIKKIEEFDF